MLLKKSGIISQPY